MPQRYRLLAVDKDPQARSWYEEFLSFNGYEVTTRDPDAVESLLANEYDIIVIGDDGNGTTERACGLLRMSRMTGPSPMLLLASPTETKVEDRARRLGADGVIRRPCGIREILHYVRRLSLQGRVGRGVRKTG